MIFISPSANISPVLCKCQRDLRALQSQTGLMDYSLCLFTVLCGFVCVFVYVFCLVCLVFACVYVFPVMSLAGGLAEERGYYRPGSGFQLPDDH